MISKKLRWMTYKSKWWLDGHYKKYTGRRLIKAGQRFGGVRLMSGEEGNEKLKQMIKSGEPFACCRFGFAEEGKLIDYLKYCAWHEDSSAYYVSSPAWQFDSNDGGAGVRAFIQLMLSAANEADILCVWSVIEMEDYIISSIENVKNKSVGLARMVEPYGFKEPWSEALEGKKVLVINPFADLIQSQYEQHRKELFENEKILPEFELLTMQSVWVRTDPRFANWMEAYDFLFEEAMKRDFDVVLMGCGALAFPLATRFKNAGKQAIQIGGALQILFGIMGKRWENWDAFKKMMNSSWVRPEKPEKEINAERLDGACYW